MTRVPIDPIGGLSVSTSGDVKPPVSGGTTLEWLKEIAPDVYAQYVRSAPANGHPRQDFRDATFNKKRPGRGRLNGTEGRMAGPGNGP